AGNTCPEQPIATIGTVHDQGGHPVTLTADKSTSSGLYEKRWFALWSLCLSLLIVVVGNTSLNVVIPTLAKRLDATNSQLQWVVAIYSLVFAGLLFTSAAIGDRFGRKGALQVGLVIFLVGSVLASQSHSMMQLILCRGLMGLAAAFVMPSTLSILVNIFPPQERQKAIAMWASVSGVGGTLGPIFSGWLLGHFWYGSVFLVNVPIIVLALVSGGRLLPKSKDPSHGKLDPPGFILSTVGIVTLVFGLIQAPEKGWASTGTMLWFGAAAVLLLAFVGWERRAKEPMLDVALFKIPTFTTGTVGMILLFSAMYGAFFLQTQYFQLILGLSPLSASLRFLPMSPVMLILGFQTPKITARLGANRCVGLGLAILSSAMFTMRTMNANSPYIVPLVAFMLMAGGVALSVGPLTAAIMSAVPPRRAGMGSAMNDATRELGAALGVAVMGSIAASHFATKVAGLLAGVGGDDRETATSSLEGAVDLAERLTGAQAENLLNGARQAFLDSLHLATTIGGVVALIASVLVLRYLPRSVSHAGAEQGHHE
ncbi:MAG: MFS transporter, partial [Actinobacteria bacterium]|nr:MFS transporter [Actinomycetota bacterium]